MQQTLESIADIGLGASTHGRSVVGRGDSYVPFINIRDIRTGYVDFSGVEDIAVEDQEKASRYMLAPHDVVVTLRGSSFRAAMVNELQKETLISSNLAYLRVKRESEISPAVLCAWLNSDEGRAQAELLQHGSGVLSISVKDLKRMPITIPDQKTQKILEELVQVNNEFKRLSDEITNKRQAVYESVIAACFQMDQKKDAA